MALGRSPSGEGLLSETLRAGTSALDKGIDALAQGGEDFVIDVLGAFGEALGIKL